MTRCLPAEHEPTHIEVRQQRQEWKPLRGAPTLVPIPGRPMEPPSLIALFHRRIQPHLDQPRKTPIADAPGRRFHQLVIGDAAEATRQVRVRTDNLRMPRVDRLANLPDGDQSIVFGPIRVLLRRKVGIEDRFQDQHHRRLQHAIANRSDPRRSELASGSGMETRRTGCAWYALFLRSSASSSSRLSTPYASKSANLWPLIPGAPSLERQRARAKARMSRRQVLSIERVEAMVERSLRFGMQRSLEFPNRFWRCEAHANLLALMLFRTSVSNSGPFPRPALPDCAVISFEACSMFTRATARELAESPERTVFSKAPTVSLTPPPLRQVPTGETG